MLENDVGNEMLLESVQGQPYNRFQKLTHIPIPWNFVSLGFGIFILQLFNHFFKKLVISTNIYKLSHMGLVLLLNMSQKCNTHSFTHVIVEISLI
jgi:hypothetical protein